jgi:hypothetical protein
MKSSRSLFVWAAFLLPAAGLAQSPAQVPVGELYASDTGSVQPAQYSNQGMSVVTGSELSAGVAPARLRLNRGGQVRICPRSSLSVTSSNTAGLMFAMGAGTLELDYRINPRVADLLITPDFSVNFVGPGTFHVALGVNKKGDTCVKPLPGNTAEISFSELLGAAIYKVKANEAVVFQGGKVSARTELKEACGCPPAPPMMRAAGPAPAQAAAANAAPVPASATGSATAPLPPEHPGQVHVEVETPFVFSANARGPAAKPYSVAKIKFSTLPNIYFLPDKAEPVVQAEVPAPTPVSDTKPAPGPVAAAEKKEKKGFFGRIGSFFHSMLHK